MWSLTIKLRKLQMGIRHNIVLAFTAISFTACVTNTIPVSQASSKPTPSKRLLAFQTPSPNLGTITVIRDKGYLGSACYLGLYINDTLAARLDVAETAHFYVEPGEVLVKVSWDPQGRGLCGIGPAKTDYTQRETLIKANEEKKFRLSIDLNAKLDVQRAE